MGILFIITKIIIRNTGFLNIVERITSLKEDYEKGEYSDGSVIYWIFQSHTPLAEGWYRHRLDGPAVYSLKGDIVTGKPMRITIQKEWGERSFLIQKHELEYLLCSQYGYAFTRRSRDGQWFVTKYIDDKRIVEKTPRYLSDAGVWSAISKRRDD